MLRMQCYLIATEERMVVLLVVVLKRFLQCLPFSFEYLRWKSAVKLSPTRLLFSNKSISIWKWHSFLNNKQVIKVNIFFFFFKSLFWMKQCRPILFIQIIHSAYNYFDGRINWRKEYKSKQTIITGKWRRGSTEQSAMQILRLSHDREWNTLGYNIISIIDLKSELAYISWHTGKISHNKW